MTVSQTDRTRLEQALLSRLEELLGEVTERLDEYWPDYAEFLRSDPEAVADAATPFVRRLVALAEPAGSAAGQVGAETVHLVLEQVGRVQMQAGNDLTRLLTAFQLGARVAWRYVSETALEIGMPPESLASLADSVFFFVNQLSFSAARGYLRAQVDDARLRARHREQLAELLLSPRAGVEAVRAAAARAGWAVPDRVAVVLVDPEDEAARRVMDRLDGSCLPIREPELHGAIVPDAHTAAGRAHLTRQLRGAHAVVGYAVPPGQLPRTVDVVHVLLELRLAGLVEGDPAFVEENLDTIIVWRDPDLTGALRRQVLAPLAELPTASRERLTETLRSWLRHQGDRHAMAEELRIHPQTVRYRMNQLRQCFGDGLDSPRERARLLLALAWTDR